MLNRGRKAAPHLSVGRQHPTAPPALRGPTEHRGTQQAAEQARTPQPGTVRESTSPAASSPTPSDTHRAGFQAMGNKGRILLTPCCNPSACRELPGPTAQHRAAPKPPKSTGGPYRTAGRAVRDSPAVTHAALGPQRRSLPAQRDERSAGWRPEAYAGPERRMGLRTEQGRAEPSRTEGAPNRAGPSTAQPAPLHRTLLRDPGGLAPQHGAEGAAAAASGSRGSGRAPAPRSPLEQQSHGEDTERQREGGEDVARPRVLQPAVRLAGQVGPRHVVRQPETLVPEPGPHRRYRGCRHFPPPPSASPPSRPGGGHRQRAELRASAHPLPPAAEGACAGGAAGRCCSGHAPFADR